MVMEQSSAKEAVWNFSSRTWTDTLAITSNVQRKSKTGEQNNCAKVKVQHPPLFDEPPELALTQLVVHGVLAASPQRRPRCGAACVGSLYSKEDL